MILSIVEGAKVRLQDKASVTNNILETLFKGQEAEILL